MNDQRMAATCLTQPLSFRQIDIPAVQSNLAATQAAHIRKLIKNSQMQSGATLRSGPISLEDALDILTIRQKHAPDHQWRGGAIGLLGIPLANDQGPHLFTTYHRDLEAFVIGVDLSSLSREDKNLALAVGIGVIALGMIKAFSSDGIIIHNIESLYDDKQTKPLLRFAQQLLLPKHEIQRYMQELEDQEVEPDINIAKMLISKRYALPARLVVSAFHQAGFK